MKREVIKQSTYLGIFSIFLFLTIEVFAMGGGGHGSHGSGKSSVGHAYRHMDGNRSSDNQDMSRKLNRNFDQDMNRFIDRDVNQGKKNLKNDHMDDNMDQDLKRYIDPDGQHYNN